MYGLAICFQAFQIYSSLIIIIGTVIFEKCLQMGFKMLISKIENGDQDRDWLRSYWAENPGPRSFNFAGPLGDLMLGCSKIKVHCDRVSTKLGGCLQGDSCWFEIDVLMRLLR